MGMRQYVSKYVTQYPELLDLVAADDSAMQVTVPAPISDVLHSPLLNYSTHIQVDGTQAPRLLFPMHLPLHEVLEGLKGRRLLKGTIRCERDNPFECYAVVHSSDGVSRRSVQIRGERLRFHRSIAGFTTGAVLTPN